MSKCTCGFDLRHDVDHADFCERKSKQVVNTYSEYRVAIDGVLIPRNQVFTKPDVQREKLADTELLKLIHDDLLMRAELSRGEKVVDISGFIWDKLKQRIQGEVE